jgi:hypothetical protein
MSKPKKRQSKIIDELHPGFTERSDRNRRAQQKGTTFEREVANAFKPLFPKAQRMFGQSREGNEMPDVGGTPFWIECAKGSTNAIHDKLRQGLEASSTSEGPSRGKPVVVVSHHGGTTETMATMRLADFLEVLDALRLTADDILDRLRKRAPQNFLESVQQWKPTPEKPLKGVKRRQR